MLASRDHVLINAKEKPLFVHCAHKSQPCRNLENAGRDCTKECGPEPQKNKLTEQDRTKEKTKKVEDKSKKWMPLQNPSDLMYRKALVPTCLSYVLYCTVSEQHFGEIPCPSLAKFVLKDNDNS